MKVAITAFILALCCSSAFAKDKPTEKVTVIENIPTTTSYNWWVDGKDTISCSGSSCTSNFWPASSGVNDVHGAVLKLKRQDGTIVIAACNAKERVGADLLTAMVGVTASATYRDCRMPDAGSTEDIDAEFHLASVKLFFEKPSLDASGKIYSETYVIRGILRPSVSPGTKSLSNFEREKGNRDAACGPVDVKVKVHTEKNQHPLAMPEAGHALIYIIQEDEFHVAMMGSFPTRYGLNGGWFGGNSNNSYFAASIDPGEQHLCAEWEIAFAHYARPLSLARFQAMPGETYYFRAHVVFASVSGAGQRTIELEPLSAEDGKALIAQSALSITKDVSSPLPPAYRATPAPVSARAQGSVVPTNSVAPAVAAAASESGTPVLLPTSNKVQFEQLRAHINILLEQFDPGSGKYIKPPQKCDGKECLNARRTFVLNAQDALKTALSLSDELVSLLDASTVDPGGQAYNLRCNQSRAWIRTYLQQVQTALSEVDRRLAELKHSQEEHSEVAKRDSGYSEENSSAGPYSTKCGNGDMQSCEAIGYLYSNGWGVQVDLSLARAFYKKACDGGWQHACTSLEAMK